MGIEFKHLRQIQQITMAVINVVSPDTEKQADGYLSKITLAERHLAADEKELKAPFMVEIQKITDAAKPWKELLEEKRLAVNQALDRYRANVAAEVAKFNAKQLKGYEKRVDTAAVKSIEDGTPMPLQLPPTLKQEPPKTRIVNDTRITESQYWAWTGINGVPDGQDGAKDLSWAQAQELKLDLPAEWFVLDTAKVTACVTRNDRVPSCIQKEQKTKRVVTVLKKGEEVNT